MANPVSSRKMKAAVLMELHKPLEIVEFDVPDPKPGQILVKVMATGICHTQLLEIAGQNTNGPMNPNLLGHEGSGIVEEVGEGVTKVKKGDHVILSWIKGSGRNVLPEKYDYQGQKINCGFVTTFNEYTLASENRVTKIPPEMPFPEAALIGCAVATGAGAVLHNANVEAGKSVLVVGLGGIGINMAHAAALRGAHPIIAVDISDEKLDFSKQFGVTHTINSSKDRSSKNSFAETKEIIQQIVGKEGLDYAFDTTGKKEIMEFIYESVKKSSGKVIFCGVPNPLGLKIEIDPFPLYFGRRVVGTSGGETNPDVDFSTFCHMFLEGKLKIREMITHTFSLHDINKGIDLMKNGKCCRVVIDLTRSSESSPIIATSCNGASHKKRYKVVYDRSNCISVLTCTSFYPERWRINEKDNKADLIDGQEDPNKPGVWVLEFTEEEFEQFKASAEVCPVNVIHIYDLATGEKII